MRIMGVDISSRCTGWSILDDGKLVDFGMISPHGKMSTSQKLFLFHIELGKLIVKYKPEEIAIEDVVQVSSVSVVKILAKFSGIALLEAYRHLQKEPYLYEPSKWKKQLDGCTGGAKKCEVQLAVCKIFNLLTEEKIISYKGRIDRGLALLSISEDLHKLNKSLAKEKEKLKKAKEELNLKKKQNKKVVDKLFDEISMEIYAETGINEDIADSIGVAIACSKEIQNAVQL